MDFLLWPIKMLFAGIWAQVWHWGTGIALIIICLAVAYFTTAIPLIGPYLGGARKPMYAAAGAIAIFLAGQWLGAHDEARKCEARKVVIEHRVDTVVEKAKTPRSRAKKDRWDRPEN